MAFPFRAIAFLLLLLPAASALLSDNPNHNVLHNGDFEAPGIKGRVRVVKGVGSQGHPHLPRGWEVPEGAVRYVRRDHWAAASGKHSVALNDDGASSLAQTFKTVPGRSYFVYFNLAGDPGLESGAHRTLNVTVRAGNELLAEKDFLIDTYRHLKFDQKIRWEEHSLAFTATEDRATVTFISTTEGVHGPVIDNVRVFKRDALTGFIRSPNTVYSSPTILTVGPTIAAEECARRCLETHNCAGFTLRLEMGKDSGPCLLKGEMKMPVQVQEFNADSYVRLNVDCTFGHQGMKPCAQVILVDGLAPMACVARRGWKRNKEHPFPGVCRQLERTDMCHMFGGYFPLGMPAIGSGDHLRRCSCVKSQFGLASMQCTKSIW